jgi:hypothetical protein
MVCYSTTPTWHKK